MIEERNLEQVRLAKELLVVIATLNEIDSLPQLVSGIRDRFMDASILVIDDNSNDGTGGWCDSYAQQDPLFQVVHRPEKLGLGTAAVLGFEHALSESFHFVATMDADLSHDPQVLIQMLGAMKKGCFTGCCDWFALRCRRKNSRLALVSARFKLAGQLVFANFFAACH